MTAHDWHCHANSEAMLEFLVDGCGTCGGLGCLGSTHSPARTCTACGGHKHEDCSPRKLRLMMCAWVRQAWHVLKTDAVRAAIGTAELYADGLISDEDRQQTVYWTLPNPSAEDFVSSGSQIVHNLLYPNGMRQYGLLGELLNNSVEACFVCGGNGLLYEDAETCHHCLGSGWACKVGGGPLPYPKQRLVVLDLFGDPFRPLTLCGMERKPFHNQHAHVNDSGGFWLEHECPACARIRSDLVMSLAEAAYASAGDDGVLSSDHLFVLSDALEDDGLCSGIVLERLRMGGPHFKGFDALDCVLGKF